MASGSHTRSTASQHFFTLSLLGSALLLGACGGGGSEKSGGGSSEVTFLDAGTGETNNQPLHPLKRGQTYGTYPWSLVRVGETFTVDGRTTVRVSTGDSITMTQSESWLHRDSQGLWLDGSGTDGLLETPVLVVPEPVRDGMRWQQKFSFKGDTVTLTGWVVRSKEDPELWYIGRQQNDRTPTGIEYREGVGPDSMLFMPWNPPVADTVPDAPLFTGIESGPTVRIPYAVSFTEDYSRRLTGSILSTSVTYDPYYNEYRRQVDLLGMSAQFGSFPGFYGTPSEDPRLILPSADSYENDDPHWGHELVKTADGWALGGGLHHPASRITQVDNYAGTRESTQWVIAHPSGTVDVQKVENGQIVRRRLGRVPMTSDQQLASAWLRADGSLEAAIITEQPNLDISSISNGSAQLISVPAPGTGALLPTIPWVVSTVWDADVEVCWNTSGAASNWKLDGESPAAVISTRPGCVLLVRDWNTDVPLDSWPESLVEGTVEDIGSFTLKPTRTQTDQWLWGQWSIQGNRRINKETSQPQWRGTASLPSGSLDCPENGVFDRQAGCWFAEAQSWARFDLKYRDSSGTKTVGSFDGSIPSLIAVPVGGVVFDANDYGAYNKYWVQTNGTATHIEWNSWEFHGDSFDGKSACAHGNGSVFTCYDLSNGDALYAIPQQIDEVHQLHDGQLLLWAGWGNSTAWVLDTSNWTATQIDGDLSRTHFGGLLSNGEIWGWRPDPDNSYYDRQMVVVRTDGKAQVASIPVSLERRNDFAKWRLGKIIESTLIQRYQIEADDDLVFWVRSQLTPSIHSVVIRVPWSSLSWQDL